MSYKGFHLIFTWKVVLALSVFMAAVDVLAFVLLCRPLGSTYGQAIRTLAAAEDSVGLALKAYLVISTLTCFFIFVGCLLMSHRISGPVYRFVQTMKLVQGGDFSIKVRLRKDDEFKEVAGQLDGFVAEYRERLRVITSLAEKAAEESLQGAGAGASALETLGRLEKELEYFRESPDEA